MKTKITRQKVVRTILQVAAVGGVLTVAMIAPNVLGAVAKLTKQSRLFTNRRYYLNQAVQKLSDKGLVVLVNNHQGRMVLRITQKGREELRRYQLGDLVIERPKKWDGNYRLIIFDIKEGRRAIRDRLRRWLLELGFVRLQNSVWVFPYECQEVVALLKSYFKIGGDVLYLVAASIENDKWLKRHFHLS